MNKDELKRMTEELAQLEEKINKLCIENYKEYFDEMFWKYEEYKEYEDFRNELERYFNNKLNAYITQIINNKVKVFLKQIKYDTEYTREKTEIDEVVDEILDLLIA